MLGITGLCFREQLGTSTHLVFQSSGESPHLVHKVRRARRVQTRSLPGGATRYRWLRRDDAREEGGGTSSRRARGCFLSRPLPVTALVRPLLAVRDGTQEAGGRERTGGPSRTGIDGPLPGGETPAEGHRERQPDHLPDGDGLHHRLLGLTGALS